MKTAISVSSISKCLDKWVEFIWTVNIIEPKESNHTKLEGFHNFYKFWITTTNLPNLKTIW